MSSFYVRTFTTDDIPFFMTECEESARDGHFNSNLLTPKGNKIFEKDVRNAICSGANNHPSGHFLLMLVHQSDDRRAGFMWVRASQDLTGNSCIEIFVVHVAKAMRGKGGGRQMITVAVEGYQNHRMTARCYSPSSVMNRMLKRRGFQVMGTSERGSEYLCRLPS